MARRRVGRVRDKWRAKKWIVVNAPPSFGGTPLAYIPITDEEKAIGRVVETTLFDLLRQDPQHYSIKLYFQIESIEGDTANTVFKGHEYAREYLRSLIRRGSSMVTLIRDYKTRDEAIVRIYVVVLTQGRINSSRKHTVRLLADRVLAGKAASLTYNQFTQEAVLGKIASDIYNEAKKVTHLRHVGVSKTKLVKRPAVPIEEAVSSPAVQEEAQLSAG